MRRSLLLVVLFAGCSGKPGKETLLGSWETTVEGSKIVYTYEADSTFISTVENKRGDPVRFRGRWRWLEGNRLEVEHPEQAGASSIMTRTITFPDRNTMLLLDTETGKKNTHRRVK